METQRLRHQSLEPRSLEHKEILDQLITNVGIYFLRSCTNNESSIITELLSAVSSSLAVQFLSAIELL